MTLRKLPRINSFERPAGLGWDAPSDALERWAALPPVRAAGDTIDIIESIGEDYWSGGGFTAKRMIDALAGREEVTVRINSPGGDFFEGLAIYNLLLEHPHQVEVRVMGVAASAASVIAMAGDQILMGDGAFLMIHQVWAVVIGNQSDLRDAAEVMGTFDTALADVYAAHSGTDADAVMALMAAETWLTAAEAIAQGFADGMIADAETAPAAALSDHEMAKRRVDALLAKAGVPRSERRRLAADLRGTQDAAPPATHDAGDVLGDLRRLTATLRG